MLQYALTRNGEIRWWPTAMLFTLTEKAASKSTTIVVNAGRNTQHRASNTSLNVTVFSVRSIFDVPCHIAVNGAIYAPVQRVIHISYTAVESSPRS